MSYAASTDSYETEVFGDGRAITACGLIRLGPKVKALHAVAVAAGDKAWEKQILSFIEVWHRLEWNDGKEPEVTP